MPHNLIWPSPVHGCPTGRAYWGSAHQSMHKGGGFPPAGDIDGDGWTDKAERDNESDPNDPMSTPVNPFGVPL